MSEKDKRSYRKRVASKKCVDCGAFSRGVRCELCSASAYAVNKQRYDYRLKKRLCVCCGVRLNNGYVRCDKHLEAAREASRRFYYANKQP